MNAKIVLITSDNSDFKNALSQTCSIDCFTADEADNIEFEGYQAIAILGGTSSTPLALPAKARFHIEEERAKGVRVFAEYCESIGDTYSAKPISTNHQRLITVSDAIPGLAVGDLVDDHNNQFSSPYFTFAESKPLLYYQDYICAHDHVDTVETSAGSQWGLWELDSSTLVCSFRIANFIKARLAPVNRWKAIVSYIIHWLTGKTWEGIYEEKCQCFGITGEAPRTLEEVIKTGIDWFTNSGMLLHDGENGVLEGLGHDITPDGQQTLCTTIRTDCCGEVAGAYRFYSRLTGEKTSLLYAKNLETFIFSWLQVKNGLHKGMLRWSNVAYGVCYQDDAARAVIPMLLDRNMGGEAQYDAELQDCLDYMVETTGQNGLREWRTDCHCMTEESVKSLHDSAGASPSAHYNAYYHAALLLGYKLWKKEEYRNVAVNGLRTIMESYPDTKREQSETEELCRLLFPLACLYDVTHEHNHLEWLLRVETDLKRFSCPEGGYAEWDTDYKATFSRTAGGECSLLAANGDPVIDLLYSNNWLPLGFAHAYHVTKDARFSDDFKSIAQFLSGLQIVSRDPMLNGGWARAYDWKRKEIYGVPHDAGWGPCCMETGWMASEILMGLTYGKIVIGK